MKFLFLGDTHGDLSTTARAVDYAADSGCSVIVQVGDFGMLWPGSRTEVPDLSKMLVDRKIHMYHICGNHDYHPVLKQLPRDKLNNVAENLTYQHRGTIREFEDGTTMVFLGGAPSIDYKGRTEGRSWWIDELITNDDINKALEHRGKKIDVLVTHDTPLKPARFGPVPDMTFNYRAQESCERLLWVTKELKPNLVVHGHYHYRYNGEVEGVPIIGLDCNHGRFEDFIHVYERKEV